MRLDRCLKADLSLPPGLQGLKFGYQSSQTSRLLLGHANDWWLQPRAVCSHTFTGVIWHCATEINSIQLHDSFVMVPLESISLHLHYIMQISAQFPELDWTLDFHASFHFTFIAPKNIDSSFFVCFVPLVSMTLSTRISWFFLTQILYQAICTQRTRKNPSNRRLYEHGICIRHCQDSNSQPF